MSTSITPAARTAFDAFIDYAGLFPPAKLAMPDALREYAAARSGAHAWMLGRFILPASRLTDALAAELAQANVPLSLIVDAPSDPRMWFTTALAMLTQLAGRRASGLRVEALEIPLPALATLRETYDATIGQCAMLAERTSLRDCAIYVELPRDARFLELLDSAMTALSRYRLRGKVRCGGVTAAAFPSVEELAAFVCSAAEHEVAYKATAGLHHPIRHHNAASGFTMHGFLNLLVAAGLAPDTDRACVEAVLAQDVPFTVEDSAIAGDGFRLNLAAIERARNAFVGYGSCSFAEPVDDLVALSILSQ